MTEHDETTIRLPHTGLRVPDLSLTVTGYKELLTHDGAAFTANLRVNKKIAGTIENEGCGGPTGFYSHRPDVFGDLQVEQYAARCRTEEGGPVDYERLLDTLLDEHDWTRKTAAAARRGHLLLRMMIHILNHDDEPIDFPPYAERSAVFTAPPTTAAQWKTLTEKLLTEDIYTPPPFAWWQAWTGDAWRDATPRPACVDSALYL